MTSNKTIEELIELELFEANEIHPQFASDHEAWAVIKEEMEKCEKAIKYASHFTAYAWEKVKKNCEIDAELKQIKMWAMNLTVEAIQVAAMCKKGMARYADTEDM